MMPWRTFLARAVTASGLVGVAMFVALRLAAASPGGPTRHELTYAGVLRDADGRLPTVARMTALTFRFTKAGATPCVVEVPRVEISAGGSFTAPVSLASCPNYFDGSDVAYTVAEGGTLLTEGGVAVTPVPYARFADQAGVTNDCPAGYTKDTSDAGASPPVVVCFNTNAPGHDDVVKVGSGASAFWIDRYEASVIDRSGIRRDTLTGVLSENGQWIGGTRESLLAVSFASVRPIVNITWFQARALCRASGKRLMTRDEWFAAADGLSAVDPDSGVNGILTGETRCNTTGGVARTTGRGTGCMSSWGAQDMIGNVAEWTDEWFAGAGNALQQDARTVAVTGGAGSVVVPAIRAGTLNEGTISWPPGFGGDGTWNVAGFTDRGGGGVLGLPAAAQRGGHFESETLAGVFALELTHAPSNAGPRIGFRCVVQR